MGRDEITSDPLKPFKPALPIYHGGEMHRRGVARAYRDAVCAGPMLGDFYDHLGR